MIDRRRNRAPPRRFRCQTDRLFSCATDNSPTDQRADFKISEISSERTLTSAAGWAYGQPVLPMFRTDPAPTAASTMTDASCFGKE
jgi:hypothetical protein